MTNKQALAALNLLRESGLRDVETLRLAIDVVGDMAAALEMSDNLERRLQAFITENGCTQSQAFYFLLKAGLDAIDAEKKTDPAELAGEDRLAGETPP